MKKALLSLGGLLVLVAVGVIVTKPPLLRIKKIECYTQFGACTEELVDRAQFLLGRPIYVPLPRKEIARTYADFPTISQVEVYRRLPSTIVLSIAVRRPIAVVLGISAERVVVDETGVVFAPIDRSALPTLKVDSDVYQGSTLTDNQLTASRQLSQVGSIVAVPVTGRLNGNILTITTSTGITIILDTIQPDNGWAASLQAIWSRSKIDGKIMRKIDLRFSRPTVSY
ncbi:MAG: hypothetical protein Q7S31_00280 [bacterium]|nr:hypothetical protein [bacterium]